MVRPTRSQVSMPRPRNQHGAAAVYAAFALIAGVSATALAIDTGQLYYAQRDLQKLATTAALDAARAFSGCYTMGGATAGAPGTPAVVKAALDASITNSLGNRLNGDAASFAEVEQAYGNGINTLEFGIMQSRVINGVPTRAFVNLGAASPRVDSIQVNLARQAPTPVLPFIFGGPDGTPITLRASAAAQQSPAASYSLATTLANVSSPQPICSLLGGSAANCLTLPVAGTGLANATLTLDALAVSLGVANGGQLEHLSFPTNVLLQGIADAVNATSDGAQSQAVSLLNQLAAVAGPAQVAIDSLINMVPGVGPQIGGLPINAGNLLTQLAMAASAGLYPVKLALPTNVPGVTLDAFLTLGATPGPGTTTSMGDDPSRLTLGRAGIDENGNKRTSANIEQLNLLLRFGINSNALPALGGVLGNAATVNIGIDISGATATSFLSSLNCPAPLTPGGDSLSHISIPVTSSAAKITIGTFTTATKSQPVMGGNLVSIAGGLITASIPGPLPPVLIGAGSDILKFKDPYTDTQSVGITSAALQTALNSLYGPLASTIVVSAAGNSLPLSLGAPLPTGGTIVSALASVLNPIATQLDPIITGLGVSLGGASVKVTGIDFGTHAGDTLNGGKRVLATNSVPVLFNNTRPFFDGDPVQTLDNGPSTR